MKISNQIIQEHGLKLEEYSKIKELLKRHLNYTNSSVAKAILDNFDKELKNFVKVLPIDFENVLLMDHILQTFYRGYIFQNFF